LEQTSLNAGNSSQGPDFSIAWATPNGQFISGSNTLSPVVGTAGTYTLTITNLQNGCSATASVVVVENMDMPGAEAGADMVLNCNETVVALAGYSPNTGVEFTWQSPDGHFLSGQNTPMPVVDSAGLYFLTVTDPANGCTGTDSVRVSRVVPEGFSIEKTAPGCLAGTGSLHFTQIQNGTPPFEYSIDGGATFSQVGLFENLPAGLYELTVEDAGGCSLTQTVELAAAQGIVIQLEAEVELGLGETYPLRPQLSIPDSDVAQVLWTPASQLSCSDCLYPNLEAVVDTTYRLEISDFNGCTATASIVVRVVTGQGIYVPNAFSPNGDGINDYLTVFARPGLVKEVLGLQVFSRWGESVFSQHHFPPNELNIGWDGTHRGKKLDSGIYVWWAEVELANGERRVLEGEILLFR
jgi:gliding motility-associated-like protein